MARIGLTILLVTACLIGIGGAGGASCVRTEIRPEPGASGRLSALGQGPGVQQTVNRLPDPVNPDLNRTPPVPVTAPRPDPQPPAGSPGIDPAQRAQEEAAALLHRPTAFGRLTCRAFDPVSRRPLQVPIRVVAENRSLEIWTDAARGEASVELPVGRVTLYCAAGEFFTPYSNQIDLQPGENSVEVLLTQVPELTPGRFGFATLAFARSARQDWPAARLRCAAGQADGAVVLGDPTATEGLCAVDGPYGQTGSRFAGLGRGQPPKLATGPAFAPAAPAVPSARAESAGAPPLAGSVAPAWDDLHRLQQAQFLRLWLYPAGRATDPQLARILGLPARQYRGPEGWLAAERGPGIELVTLGAHGEGEAEYFALLNRGLPVAAIAEPEDADRPAQRASVSQSGSLAAETGSGASTDTYQSLPADLYAAAITPRTLVRLGQFTPLNAPPTAADTLQWLRAGQAQVAYGPVLDWKVREFIEVVGYPAQPIPAADRLYHLDLSAFIGPGAPPEFRSIQLIELLRNGKVVAQLPIDRPLQTVRDLSFEIRETTRCWYLLRAYSGAAAENRPDTRAPQPHWRYSWSAPIHFAAAGEAEAPVYARRGLPIALRAFRALDGLPVDAEAIVTRGGFLVQKVALKAGRGEVTARVGDHILVGGPAWDWRETVVSPYENRSGDPWRAIDAEPRPPVPVADGKEESVGAANARLSGLGILCPLTPRSTAGASATPAPDPTPAPRQP